MLVEKLALREWTLIAGCYELRGMRTIEEIRHARLLQLLEDKQTFPTIQALADRIERSHAQVSQWKNRSERRNKDGEVVGRSNIDSASARWIEERLGKPIGWMDNDPNLDRAADAGPQRRVDFTERRVSDSDWAALEAIRVLPQDEREALLERASKLRAYVQEMSKVIASSNVVEIEKGASRPKVEPGLIPSPIQKTSNHRRVDLNVRGKKTAPVKKESPHGSDSNRRVQEPRDHRPTSRGPGHGRKR